MQRDEIIHVTDLCKSFDDKIVVNNLNLSVQRGEVFGFLGPNGSGKTTTIRMLCGIITPDSGTGNCLGYDIFTEPAQIKQKIGYMTQKFSFYMDLSVEENLNFIAAVYGVPHAKERVQHTLHEQGLYKRRNQLMDHLSGGWKQRVALAGCLLHDPELLLLDEPTAGIDPIARREFWDTIHGLSEKGITTLMSTHYMDEAERCTRLAYIAYGDLIVTGSVDDVIAMTKLHTWDISGDVTTKLLKQVKQLPGVTQAALFGRHLHVCGFDIPVIEQELEKLCLNNNTKWRVIDSTLEDAFISLVKGHV